MLFFYLLFTCMTFELCTKWVWGSYEALFSFHSWFYDILYTDFKDNEYFTNLLGFDFVFPPFNASMWASKQSFPSPLMFALFFTFLS